MSRVFIFTVNNKLVLNMVERKCRQPTLQEKWRKDGQMYEDDKELKAYRDSGKLDKDMKALHEKYNGS